MSHQKLEKNINLMGWVIAIVISIGGIAEIVPLIAESGTSEPAENIVPHTALQLAGRDLYIREGCFTCHSMQIRPFHAETERYGHYSLIGESVYDRPFQWGSKRTGPDLARVGGRYSDLWHELHLINPRDVVPESNMPGFPWLMENTVDGRQIARNMQALKTLGHPYTDEQIASAADDVEGKTEMQAMIAYLQSMGTNLR